MIVLFYTIGVWVCVDWQLVSVQEQISKQASHTFHRITREKRFTENSAMARLWDILRSLGPASPKYIHKWHSWSNSLLRQTQTNLEEGKKRSSIKADEPYSGIHK